MALERYRKRRRRCERWHPTHPCGTPTPLSVTTYTFQIAPTRDKNACVFGDTRPRVSSKQMDHQWRQVNTYARAHTGARGRIL